MTSLKENFYGAIFNGTFDGRSNAAYALAMDTILGTNTLVTAFVVWLILCKSSAQMKHYKLYLLNATLCAYIVDTILTGLDRPLIVNFEGTNVHGSCSMGIIKIFGSAGNRIISLFFIASMTIFGFSLILAMLFRYFSLRNKEGKLLSKKAILLQIFAQIAYGLPCVLCLAYNDLLMDSERDKIEDKDLLNIMSKFEQHACSFRADSGSTNKLYIFYLLFSVCLMVVLIVLSDRELRKLRSIINGNNNYKHQRELLWALILQFLIPAILVGGTNILVTLIPVGLGFQMDPSRSNPIVCNFPASSRVVYALASTHSTANGLLLIGTIKPYRHTVKEMLGKIKWSRKKVAPRNTIQMVQTKSAHF